MPRTNLEESVWGDPRFDDLAEFCGLANRFEAIGRMAALWHACAVIGRDKLRAAEVARYLGERGSRALVAADLGEAHGDLIRVKGCAGRTDTWNPNNAQQVAAGKNRAKNAVRIGGKFIKEAGNKLVKTSIGDVSQNVTTDEDSTRTCLESPPCGTSGTTSEPPAALVISNQRKTSGSPAYHQRTTSGTSLSDSDSDSDLRSYAPLDAPEDLKKSCVFQGLPEGSRAFERSTESPETHTRFPKIPVTTLPADWQPSAKASQLAATLGLKLADEARLFGNLKRAQAHTSHDWDANFCAFLDGSAKRQRPQSSPVAADKPRRLKQLG